MKITSEEKFLKDDAYLQLKISGPEKNDVWDFVHKDLVDFMDKKQIKEKLRRLTMMDDKKEIVIAFKKEDFPKIIQFLKENGITIGGIH
jgi:hypothetical protein